MTHPKIISIGSVPKVDPEVQEEGGGNLQEQAWEREQAGLNDGEVLIDQIGFDGKTLEKIRAKKGNSKEL
jgi:hypothetical protein